MARLYYINGTLPAIEHGDVDGCRELVSDGLFTVKELMAVMGINAGISLMDLYDSASWIRIESSDNVELYPIGEDGVALFHQMLAIKDTRDLFNYDQWWKHYALYGPAQEFNLVIYSDMVLTLPEEFDASEFLARKMDA